MVTGKGKETRGGLVSVEAIFIYLFIFPLLENYRTSLISFIRFSDPTESTIGPRNGLFYGLTTHLLQLLSYIIFSSYSCPEIPPSSLFPRIYLGIFSHSENIPVICCLRNEIIGRARSSFCILH